MSHFVVSAWDPSTGRAAAGYTAEIQDPGTFALLSIYSDKNLTSLKSNPITLNTTGDIDFYMQSGTRFNLVLKKLGVTLKTLSNLEMVGSDS